MNHTLHASARQAVRATVPPAVWSHNETFSAELSSLIDHHRLMSHPILTQAGSGDPDPVFMARLFASMRWTTPAVFVGAMCRTMELAAELEAPLGMGAVIASRFLMTLNLLDELGFEETPQGVRGDPSQAHLATLDRLLGKLGLDDADIAAYAPSEADRRTRALLEDVWDDRVLLLAVIAFLEAITPGIFAAAPSALEEGVGVEDTEQYFDSHQEGDVEHGQDVWFLLNQAIPAERHGEVRAKIVHCCDTAADLLDEHLQRMMAAA